MKTFYYGNETNLFLGFSSKTVFALTTQWCLEKLDFQKAHLSCQHTRFFYKEPLWWGWGWSYLFFNFLKFEPHSSLLGSLFFKLSFLPKRKFFSSSFFSLKLLIKVFLIKKSVYKQNRLNWLIKEIQFNNRPNKAENK